MLVLAAVVVGAWLWGDGTIVKRNMTYTLLHGRPVKEEGAGVQHEERHVESGDIHDALQSYRRSSMYCSHKVSQFSETDFPCLTLVSAQEAFITRR